MPEIIQGRFTSTGLSTKIALPVEIDQFETYNFTKAASGTATGACFSKWYRGMDELASPNGQAGIYDYKNGSAALNMTVNVTATPGFQLYDDSTVRLSQSIAITGITNAATFTVTGPVGLGGLQNGDVVILQSLGTANLNNISGFPIQVAAVNSGAGTFQNAFPLEQAPGAVATTGSFRIVYSSPQPFYPTQRYIVNINGQTITTSVAHGYTVGQTVIFSIPQTMTPNWGMTELDGLSATILTVPSTSTFTIDLNLSAFTAFSFPNSVVGAFNFATVAPAYMNTAVANQLNVNPYSDARQNLGTKGMILYPGPDGPAGETGNVIYWSAIAASSVNNM